MGEKQSKLLVQTGANEWRVISSGTVMALGAMKNLSFSTLIIDFTNL
jgi:hypothetical protein